MAARGRAATAPWPERSETCICAQVPEPVVYGLPTAICTTCWELSTTRLQHVDRCACPRTPSRPHSAAEAAAGEPCRLCAVCAIGLAPGHSRWRLHHCKSCTPKVRELNARLGRLVVPVGIHSLVNGAGLRVDPDADGPLVTEEDAERFAAQLHDIHVGSLRLAERRRALVRSRCERLGLIGGRRIRLDEYLEACEQAGFTRHLGWRAFLGETTHPN